MKIVYATAQGKTEALIKDSLGITNAVKIIDGTEKIGEPFILFTYTDGIGETPKQVETFLLNNGAHIKAVVGSGNIPFHADTFAFAADNIAQKYNVPILYKIDCDCNADDIRRIKLLLLKWTQR
ncbi:MAG: class Ib ribonucleoside-diphosphate reductase assembly flavoprotein NrdI [Treponema sp.]|nr:class Ib ribonucleoside-diphosphate reductase assembly flavoprotein NrdI [Treponema sp.]